MRRSVCNNRHLSARNLESRQRYSVCSSSVLLLIFFLSFGEEIGCRWQSIPSRVADARASTSRRFFLFAGEARTGQKLDVLVLFIVEARTAAQLVQSINSSPGKTTVTARFSVAAPADSARDTAAIAPRIRNRDNEPRFILLRKFFLLRNARRHDRGKLRRPDNFLCNFTNAAERRDFVSLQLSYFKYLLYFSLDF